MNGLLLFGYFILLIATVKSDVSEILNKERDSGNVARPSKLFQPPRFQDINLNKPVPDDLSLNTAVDIGIIKNQQKKITSDTTNNNQRFNQLVSLNRNDDKLWINSLPGEADKDYPIYSTPPVTGFSCKDRLEGYYADTEARCQVFRVCANTDDTGKGFAFLCPNGTLFNQKYFVCDWYMNVECSESENFYYKNEEIGKTTSMTFNDMMKAVQKMLDYPKNNYKNINSNPPFDVRFNGNNKNNNNNNNNNRNQNTENNNRNNLNNNNINRKPQFNNVNNPQRINTPSVPFPNNNQQPINTNQPARNQFGGNNNNNYPQQPAPVRNNQQFVNSAAPVAGEVYVSSLGQLSSDPESGFDPKTAYIIGGGGGGSAEPFLFNRPTSGQSYNRGTQQQQQYNYPNIDAGGKQIYTYPTTTNGQNQSPVIEEYKTSVIRGGGNGVLVSRPQYNIIPSIEESVFQAPTIGLNNPQTQRGGPQSYSNGELNSGLFPQQRRTNYVYNKPKTTLNARVETYNSAQFTTVNQSPPNSYQRQHNYQNSNNAQLQNFIAEQPRTQPQYVAQEQVPYLPPSAEQYSGGFQHNSNRRTQNIPIVLPSVVQTYQPGKKAKVIRTEPARANPGGKVVVDIVPALGFYWNNENERRSYFEAVSQGLLDTNGNVYVNNIKESSRRNKHDARQIQHHHHQQTEQHSSRYNGFSSYNVPLGSIGPLS